MPPSESTLNRLIQRANSLYTLPAVAVKILELTGSEKVDTQALKEHLENDPALCAKLLRVVNSSLFGLSRSVDDLNQALALLGTKPLKLLVLGFSLPEELMEAGSEATLARYWRFALTKAVAARQISEKLWECPGDDAFLAGLFEDIGMLVMMRELGEPYTKFLDRVSDSDADLCQLERDSLGFDHIELSVALLEQWRFPQSLVAAVSRPRTMAGLTKLEDDESNLPQVTHLANLVTQLVAQRRLRVLPDLIESGQRLCGLTKTKLTELITLLEEKVDSLAEILSLTLASGESYAEVLQEAHERLSMVAADAAETLVGQQVVESANEQRLLDEAAELAEATERIVSRSSNGSNSRTEEVNQDAGKRASSGSPQSSRETGSPSLATIQATPQQIEETHRKFRTDLVQRLEVAVAACRQHRCELSLLRVGSSGQENPTEGSRFTPDQLRRLATDNVEEGVDHPLAETWLLSDSDFAVILLGCDRKEAIRQSQQLLRRLESLNAQSENESDSKAWSIGSATVPAVAKNFEAVTLLDSAERCLYAAEAGGASTVKSIEIS